MKADCCNVLRRSIKRRGESARQRGLLGVAARRRKMAEVGQNWTVHEHLLRFAISPDGRHVALAMPNGWQRCGSERTIRAALARAIWTRTAA